MTNRWTTPTSVITNFTLSQKAGALLFKKSKLPFKYLAPNNLLKSKTLSVHQSSTLGRVVQQGACLKCNSSDLTVEEQIVGKVKAACQVCKL